MAFAGGSNPDEDETRRYEATNSSQSMYYASVAGNAVPVKGYQNQPPPNLPYQQYEYQAAASRFVPPPVPPSSAIQNGGKKDPEGTEVGPIESNREKKQHLMVRILRVLFIIFQSIALLAGIALVIIGSIWHRQVHKHNLQGTFFGTLPMFAIGGGVALTLISCIGLVSAITRGRSGAVVYSLLLTFLIGSQGYMLWRAGRLDNQIMSFLSRKWDEMKPDQLQVLQRWRKCCGFRSPDDRAMRPCPKGASIGCAIPIHGIIKKWATSIIKALGVSMCVEIILIVLALVISYSQPKY